MEEPLGFLFKQIHDKFERDINCRNQKVDITMSQSSVLWYLYGHMEETVTQKELQHYLQLSHPTVIGLLRRLEQKGFVQISVSANDRRCRVVALTPKAKQRQEAIRQHHRKSEVLLREGMSDVDVQTLRRLLGIVLHNLDHLETL